MGKSLTRKIIESHFVSGDMTPGKEIFIKVDIWHSRRSGWTVSARSAASATSITIYYM